MMDEDHSPLKRWDVNEDLGEEEKELESTRDPVEGEKERELTPLDALAKRIQEMNEEHGFYWNVKLPKDVATAISLIHQELSEALDALRDDDVTEIKRELLGAMIRILHLLALYKDVNIEWHDYSIDRMMKNELDFNEGREHKHGRKFF